MSTSTSIVAPVNMAGTAAPDAFKSRTVIVTGGAGKIGRAICYALGESGADIVVVDINPEIVTEFVKDLTTAGFSAIGIPLSAIEGPEIIKQTLEKFGRLDAVIQPIVAPFPWKNFEDMPEDIYRSTFETDVIGPISVCKAAWPIFKEQKYGRVVLFTSASGPFGHHMAATYSTTKGALFALCKTLAIEGEPYNITTNCISPIALPPVVQNKWDGMPDFRAHLDPAFADVVTPESNVPITIALAHEKNTANGEMFFTTGYGVSRHATSLTKGINGLKTMDDCFKAFPELLAKNTKDNFEPKDKGEFSKYMIAYTLGREFDPLKEVGI